MIIDDAPRRGAGLIAIGIHRKNPGDGTYGGVLFSENQTAAERVFVGQFVARIEFCAVRENVAIYPRGHAVENEVAHIIGSKKDRAVTIENRGLEIEIARILLIGKNFVSVIF